MPLWKPFAKFSNDIGESDRARLAALRTLIQEFDARNPPHPIAIDGVVQAYVHYGSSPLSRRCLPPVTRLPACRWE